MSRTSFQNPTPVADAPVVAGAQAPATARQMYDAARAFRSELRNQLDRQEDLRGDLRQELSESDAGTAERAGLEARIKDVDARIASLDDQIAQADLRVAAAAAVPGATAEPPRPPDRGPPEEVVAMSALFILAVMMPISIAYARRIWKRSPAAAEMPRELTDRLGRLEEAVDAVAVELERVGEGQRYVTRVIGEQAQRVLGAGAAEPLDVRQRDALRQARP